ncbi:orotidine 5'-phosphate decarboxylase [Coniosporium apollinis]|uniref:Orotidine 5'-phosphate decarboxylase n=1 Tax=Coniosporium apollinis TaxID=61459 RepID=A0ABQ9NQ56_9PEZI|nr:orotidine 5'-phosphate decarboxylase [Coniosporium apollinis]
MASAAPHPTRTQTYRERAFLPGTSSLAAYLLRLIAIKRTNLCLSADVTTTAELLAVAEEVGDSICVLKTHADIINDFGDRTIKGLRDIARRKRFLIFEDRKFGDIGETVQKQYTAGPLRISFWADITNAHIFPGPAIVRALKEAAASTIASYNTAVHTEISASPHSTPFSDSDSPDFDDLDDSPGPPHDSANDFLTARSTAAGRKESIVSISTTISQHNESISPQACSPLDMEEGGDGDADRDGMLERLGPPPFLRALLLLAEMSSEGNLLTGSYTEQCVAIAREHRDFVMGFIAQRALNGEEGDNFVTMTPGVQLPKEGQEAGGKMGDDLGQQYNTPTKMVGEMGCDVVIVGRGILAANDRAREAERYRAEAWRAYEERTGLVR